MGARNTVVNGSGDKGMDKGYAGGPRGQGMCRGSLGTRRLTRDVHGVPRDKALDKGCVGEHRDT